jgi:organic hydroperoxide reductase OsmC/OhrA
VAIDSKVTLSPNGSGGFVLGVVLDVSIASVTDRDVAAQIIKDAHEVCPYSNAVRGNVDVELLLGGQPL